MLMKRLDDSYASRVISRNMATSFAGEFSLQKADHSSDLQGKSDTDCSVDGNSTRPDDSLDPLDPIRWNNLTKSQPAPGRHIVKSTVDNSIHQKSECSKMELMHGEKKYDDFDNCEYDEIGLMCEKDFIKFNGGNRSNGHQEISRSNTLKPLAHNKKVPLCKQLYEWAVIPGQNQIQIEGRIRGDDSTSQLYRTSTIVSVSSFGNRVCTASGSTYQLNGDMLLGASICAGIHVDVAKKFLKGFPKDWKSYLQHLIPQTCNQDASVFPSIGDRKYSDKQGANNKEPAIDEVGMVTKTEEELITESSTDTAMLNSSPMLDQVNMVYETNEATNCDPANVKHADTGYGIKNETKIRKKVHRKRKSTRTTTTNSTNNDEHEVGQQQNVSTRKLRSCARILQTENKECITVKRTRNGGIVIGPHKLDQLSIQPKQPAEKTEHIPVKQTRSGRYVIRPYWLDQSSVQRKPKTETKNQEYVPVKQTRSGRSVVRPYRLGQLSVKSTSDIDTCSCKPPVKKKPKRVDKHDQLNSAKSVRVNILDEKLNESKAVDLNSREYNSRMKSRKSRKRTRSVSKGKPKTPSKMLTRNDSQHVLVDGTQLNESKAVNLSSRECNSQKKSQKSQKRTRNMSKGKPKASCKTPSEMHSKNDNERTVLLLSNQKKCKVVLTPMRRSLCNAYSLRNSLIVEKPIPAKEKGKILPHEAPSSGKTAWSSYKKGQLRKLVNADLSWSDISDRLTVSVEECREVYNNMKKTRKRTKAKTDHYKEGTTVSKLPRKGTLKHREHMRNYLNDIMKKPDIQKQDIFYGEPDDSSSRNFFNVMCNKENFVPVTPNCKAPWLEESCTTPAWFKTPTGQSDLASTLSSETPVASKEIWYERVNVGDDKAKRKEADKVILQLGKKMAKAALPLTSVDKNHGRFDKKTNAVNADRLSVNLRTVTESIKSANDDNDGSDKDDYFQLDHE